MPAWIHDRAMKLKKQMEDTYPPEKAKQVAFAVATQQAHKTGKSPKTFVSKQTGHKERFGTSEGRAEAKAKFDKPKSEYKKTAAAIMFDSFADELSKIAEPVRIVDGTPEAWPEKERAMHEFLNSPGKLALMGLPAGALIGGVSAKIHGERVLPTVLAGMAGAPLGGLAAGYMNRALDERLRRLAYKIRPQDFENS